MNAVGQRIEPTPKGEEEEEDGMDLDEPLGDDPDEKAVYERFMRMMRENKE